MDARDQYRVALAQSANYRAQSGGRNTGMLGAENVS